MPRKHRKHQKHRKQQQPQQQQQQQQPQVQPQSQPQAQPQPKSGSVGVGISNEMATKIIKENLLIIHSYFCLKLKKDNSEHQCHTLLCSEMGVVVEHVLVCHNEECQDEYCIPVKFAIAHFVNCSGETCIVCDSTKLNYINQGGSLDPNEPSSSTGSCLDDFKAAFSHL